MSVKSKDKVIEITAFGHRFRVRGPHAEDLITLEKEGAIYSHFVSDGRSGSNYVRIRLLPGEIVQYVEAMIAMQEYQAARNSGCDFDEALDAISNPTIAQRVRSYGNYGNSKRRDGHVDDIRGCLASFWEPDLEALLCGGRPERYEVLPNLEAVDKTGILAKMIVNFPVVVAHLADRNHGGDPFLIKNENDAQDLLFASIRSIFEDARLEEWTPKHGGRSKRIDIVIPSAETVIEVKFVRDKAHGRKIDDELRIDIESYHNHPSCKSLLFFVYDPDGQIKDPWPITNDLSGRRIKGNSEFDVKLFVIKK